MIPESSVLPSYQECTPNPHHNERTPLLPTNTPTTTKSKRTFRAQYLVPLLFLIPILCAVMGAFMGAFIDRALTSDIADPRVRDRIRHDWEAEEKRQQRQMEALKVKIQNLNHTLEEVQDREKKERWERQTRHLYWDNVKGFRCEGYGLRIYTGYLANLSPSMDVIAACKAIPVTINGITYDSPLYCEDHICAPRLAFVFSQLIKSFERGDSEVYMDPG